MVVVYGASKLCWAWGLQLRKTPDGHASKPKAIKPLKVASSTATASSPGHDHRFNETCSQRNSEPNAKVHRLRLVDVPLNCLSQVKHVPPLFQTGLDGIDQQLFFLVGIFLNLLLWCDFYATHRLHSVDHRISYSVGVCCAGWSVFSLTFRRWVVRPGCKFLMPFTPITS